MKKNNDNLSKQRQLILKALRDNPKGLTTIQLREIYDCIAPAARIYELRHDFGYNIQTQRTFDTNAQGKKHKIAKYILLNGTWTSSKTKKAA